jgi:hypothetical protein
MASKPKRKPPTSDRGVPVSTRPAMPWATTPGQYIAGKEFLDTADQLGVDMDRYWGVGRLRMLVDETLREKFDRQKYLMAQARWEGTLEDVKREGARMVKAYQALDKAAKDAGAKPCAPEVWEVGIEQGIFKGVVVAIVKNHEDVAKVQADGRHTIVYTLEEIGRLISFDNFSMTVKQVFEGGEVMPARKVIDPINPSLSIDEDGIPDVKAPIDGIIGFDFDVGDDPPF